MFNKEYVAHVLDLYGAQQLVVDREGQVFALRPEGQLLIPGFGFDTDTVDGTVAAAVLAKAGLPDLPKV